jgi:hypothetical protein
MLAASRWKRRVTIHASRGCGCVVVSPNHPVRERYMRNFRAELTGRMLGGLERRSTTLASTTGIKLMKGRILAVSVVLSLCSWCVALAQTSQGTSLFGGELVRSETGDVSLSFPNVTKHNRSLDGGTVRLVWFEGEIALLTQAANEHWASSSRSYGNLLICKNRALFNVSDGRGARGYAKALPEDNIEVPIANLELKYHDDTWNGTETLATLREPSKKRGLYLSGRNRSFYLFLEQSVKDFDGAVHAMAQAANLKDIDHDLVALSHFRRTSTGELEQYVAQEKKEQKAEEAREKANHSGGGGLDALLAITTGVAQGMAEGGNNTPIMQTANQQAAAIRAVGDRNAQIQQQAAQARAQQAAQARLAAQLAAQQAAIAAQQTGTPVQQAMPNPTPSRASSGGRCGSAGVADSRAGQTAPRTPPRDASRCVSVTVINRSQGYLGDYLLTNNCGEYVNVSFSTAAHPTGADSASLSAGETHHGLYADSAYRLWACTNEAVPIDNNSCAIPAYNATSVSCM